MVDSNSVIGILLGCALLGGMIYWFRELQKKQGRPIGEILTIGAVTQIETLLMFLTMITYGSEAMTAANVSVEGHVMPNIMARMALHMVISFVGWLCEVTLARDLASVFEKGLDSGSRIARIALALFVILFTIKVPLWNLELIAANLGQDATFGLYLYSLVPWHSAKDVSDLCVLYGYPANYSPWANLEPILRASFIATYVTVGLAAIAGLRNIGSKERRSLVFGTLMKGSDDKKKDTGGTKGKEQKKEEAEKAKDALRRNLEFLIKRIGYKDSDKIESLTEKAYANYTRRHTADMGVEAAMAARIATLVTGAQSIDSGTYKIGSITYNDKKAANDALIEAIMKLFGNSPNEAKIEEKGLGVTLAKPKE